MKATFSISASTSSSSRTSAEAARPTRTRAARSSASSGQGWGELGDPISSLRGAGPVTRARLEDAGIRTVADLLTMLPRDYDDLRRVTPLADIGKVPAGATVLVRGRVATVRVFPRRFLAVTLEGESDGAEGQGAQRIVARWFRAPGGMSRAYIKGAEVALAGPLRFGPRGEPELVHPTNVTAAVVAASGAGLGIRPRYPAIEGVGGRIVEKIVGAAVDRYASAWPELLATAACQRLGLPTGAEALRAVHTPAADIADDAFAALAAGRSLAHRRLALEELLIVQAMLARRRAVARSQPGRACTTDAAAVMARLESSLPFVLTAAQARAIGEIHRDMATSEPMHRLLVGDVGSGKTVVAFAAAVLAAASGGQTLLMAPTEVLAEQHARVLRRLAEAPAAGGAPLLKVALLTASTPRPQRESILALARAGRIALLVGTHALLSDDIAVPDLRLAIVDEQHRFGVAQRARLGRESAVTAAFPHLLVMTATPIPRTLAQTVWGDLDVSVLDEKPAGRTPIDTVVLGDDEGRQRATEALRAVAARGERAFVVCPVRSESAREDGVTAIARHQELAVELAPTRVGLIHGALDTRTKERALADLASGALDVLVATTVIEVGIDVPAATLMVIEEADRFGLAQLHQLRGRVGRGDRPGLCLLLIGRDAPAESRARLEVLASTDDGFRIAEADLQLRGFGELFGSRQAGVPRIRFGDLASYGELLEVARGEATRILAEDPTLELPEHTALRAAVERREVAGENVFAEEAG